MIALLTKTNMRKKVGSEMFDRDNSTDFELLHSQKSEVAVAAEERDKVRQAIFFDNPYSDETISASANIKLCTTKW